MGRYKKDGMPFNCYMKKDIFDNLSAYSSHTGIPKTAVVEKALTCYLNKVFTDAAGSELRSFLDKYSDGEYVFPEAVVRSCDAIDDFIVIPVLDTVSCLVKMKFVRCPHCGQRAAFTAYDQPFDDICTCNSCGDEFKVSAPYDIVYRKDGVNV